MLRKFASIAGAIALATVLGAQSASAAVISFDDDALAQTGTLSSNGVTVVGTNILFSSISASGANGAAPLACTGCALNFTSGVFGGGQFGPGGTLTITGSILGSPNMVLVSGSFSNAGILSGNGQSTFSGFGSDEKAPLLLNYFGIAPGTLDFVNTETSVFGAVTPGTAFGPLQVSNADFDNENRPVIPEPASLILLGSGLLGVGRAVRRRRMNKA